MCLTSTKPLKKRKSILPIVGYKYVVDTFKDEQCFSGPCFPTDNKYGRVLHAKDLDYHSENFGEYIDHLTIETNCVYQRLCTENMHKIHEVKAGYHAYTYKRGQRILEKSYLGDAHFVIIPPFTEYIENNDGGIAFRDIVATRMIVCKDKKQLVWCYLLSLLGLNKRSR
jgi:hypothetical protein